MGGIGLTLGRLPAARVLFAGAALLAATTSARAQGYAPARSDDRATPARHRPAPRVGAAATPRPLDAPEAARIRRILAAQHRGNLASAFRDSAEIDTSTPLGRAMLGHVLADRYLGRPNRASAAELSGWLIVYPDRPDAPAIHALLVRRLPRGADVPPLPPRPKSEPLPALAAVPLSDPLLPAAAEPARPTLARNPRLDRTVRERANAGQAESALELIAGTRGLGASYAAQLRAEVAEALFTQNRDEEALKLAAAALGDSDREVGLAAQVAGLAAWRLGRQAEARRFFEAAANATFAPPALRSAGSFWAARARLIAGDAAGYAEWLARTAESPRTFYGLLARHVIAAHAETAAHPAKRRDPPPPTADIQAIAAEPEGLIAFALLEVGQPERAEAELRHIAARARSNVALRRAVRTVAEQAKLPNLPTELASLAPAAPKNPRAAASAEVAELQPRDGFRVDPALIFALTRLESNFDPAAVSSVGARGLMQIMPMTASYMAGDERLDSASLDDPEINLELGQRYVLHLAEQDTVGGDLIRLLASYNAGPGRCAEWDIHDQGDPFLFLEAIPITETRLFVQRVLTYSWAYAERFGLPTPSLDELAAGAFPRFRAIPTSSGKQTLAQSTRPPPH